VQLWSNLIGFLGIERHTLITANPSQWHGSLDLVYGWKRDATQVIHAQTQAPLKLQRPFYPEGKEFCHSVVLHTAGGIVGGDRLTQKIHLQPHTQGMITTAAAAKVYRSNGQEATQQITLNVDAGAYLEWLPQETILFNGAKYRQDIRVNLADGGCWLGWEITRFGRTARGEKFTNGEARSRLEIWKDNQPLWIDRQWFPASTELFESPYGLAGQPVVGSLVWIGIPISQEIITQIRQLWQQGNYTGEAGVTMILAAGLVCRYRGTSTTQVRRWFCQVWGLLRRNLRDRDGVKVRVWF
jgi:urease accessory protein